jgi:hypothetical protein
MTWFRKHLTFANVISMMALFIALGGGAYAATLAKNSVGSKQLKKNAVTSSKIRKNAVTSSKVKNGSLKAGDFAAGQLPAGARGPAGANGTNGATGAEGPQGVPGEAVAYARVDPNGTLIGGAAQNKGITQSMIQHTAGASAAEVAGTGVYCFGGLGFTPTSAVVSTDNTDAMPAAPTTTGGSLNSIPSVAVFKGEDLGYCDNAHGQTRVAMEQVNDTAAPTLANHGFFIWFEK